MNLKASPDRFNEFFTKHPAWFFLSAAVAWVALMCFLNYKDGANFQWHDILVEANGMAFDLLVFGILLSIYEALREKREKIERLHEEIDDYRGWDEKEATYRIVGAVKRLNKAGVSKINVSYCFLKKAELLGINLSGGNLLGAKLSKANLSGTYLPKANLSEANLSGAYLVGADLVEADFSMTNLSKATLWRATLSKTYLMGAILWKADLSEADLSMANLWRADLVDANLSMTNLWKADLSEVLVGHGWFEKLDHWQVIGREEIKQKYYINEEGRLIEKIPSINHEDKI